MSSSTIPDRFLRILRTCEDSSASRFPPTEVFNEGWMLRLVLDAFQALEVRSHPLSFEPGAEWFSEARLESPFRPRMRADALAEGSTNADGVIGHFDIRPLTRAGLRLSPTATQFVVVEAKMFSSLSSGTRNAREYNQAARNVACMAAAIMNSERPLDDFASVGFHVLAPRAELRGGTAMLETFVQPDAIRSAVRQRVATYATAARPELDELRLWESEHFSHLVDRIVATSSLSVLSWDDCIDAIRQKDRSEGQKLENFYKRCCEFAPGMVQLST